ncbi:MAG: hypothetical protein ACI4JW_10905 [Oscillospiraceae bacterium]
MKENTLKRLIAIAAAAVMLGGCGYIEDFSEDGTDKNASAGAAVSEEQTEDSADTADDESSEGQTDVTDESADENSAEDSSELSSEESSSASDSENDVDESCYVNGEFGFTLPLPEGTEYYENEDILKESFDDSEVLFRSLMDTKSNDLFNMSVQLWETSKTLDDFAKDRWENADRVNNEGLDTIQILDTSNEAIGEKPAQAVIERLDGANGTFYSLRVYISISDGQYIYIQGNCYDEDTVGMLYACVLGISFS